MTKLALYEFSFPFQLKNKKVNRINENSLNLYTGTVSCELLAACNQQILFLHLKTMLLIGNSTTFLWIQISAFEFFVYFILSLSPFLRNDIFVHEFHEKQSKLERSLQIIQKTTSSIFTYQNSNLKS